MQGGDTLFDIPAPRRAPLGEHPRARRADPDEAHEAAASIGNVAAAALEAEILAAFVAHGPMADWQVCDILVQRYAPTIVSCCTRLRHAGVLVKTDGVSVSPRGRRVGVYRLADSARGAA